MRIVIAGGHGKIALLLARQLADAGHVSVNLIRNPDHAAEVAQAGGKPVVLDLENSAPGDVAEHLFGADAVVFAAGAGPGSTAARKLTVDRDGATLLAAAAQQADVSRYVMVSAIATDDFDPESDDIYQVYLRAKSEADATVRATDLRWTIVRPGGLTDDPGTRCVQVAESTGRGSIARADVAAVLLACLVDDSSIGKQFELISGVTPIADAVASL